MEETLPIILTTASTLVVMIVGWGLKLLSAYISSKTKNENLIAATNTFTDVVDTTVKGMDQVFSEWVKQKDYTPEQVAALKKSLKKKVLTMVNEQLPAQTKTQLEKAVNDFEKYMDTKVEAAVKNMKAPKA